MITIAHFSKPEEAHLFRMRLGAAGIQAYVIDENVIQTYWLYSNLVGGVRVQIAEEDAEAVKEFLEADEPQESPDALNVLCPLCESPETAPDEWYRRRALLGVLVFHFPIPFSRRWWRCEACSHLFTLPEGERLRTEG